MDSFSHTNRCFMNRWPNPNHKNNRKTVHLLSKNAKLAFDVSLVHEA